MNWLVGGIFFALVGSWLVFFHGISIREAELKEHKELQAKYTKLEILYRKGNKNDSYPTRRNSSNKAGR